MSTKKTPKKATTQAHKSFADHIGELRIRLAVVALLFLVSSSIAYSFRDILVAVVLAPIGDQKLVYLTPAGGFSFIFQITMYAGAVVTAPALIYHLYRFVQPALPKRATRYSLRVIVAATLLMLAGVCFGYFVAVPAALHFLTDFAGDYVVSNLTADSYLNFIVAYVVGLGILFELPLLLVFWNWINPIPKGGLWNSQRFVIVGAFIAAAVITPTPDILNQSMVAVPIIAIYQLGAIAVFVSNRRLRQQEKKERAAKSVYTSYKVTHPVPQPIQEAHQPVVQAMTPASPTTPASVVAPSVPTPARPRQKPVMVDGFRPIRRAAPVRPPIRLPRPQHTRQSIDGLSRLPRQT